MRATMTAAAQAAQTASEAPAAAGGGGGAAVAAPAVAGGGGGGTPQAAILQSRALVTPPVTVVGQVSMPSLSWTGGTWKVVVSGFFILVAANDPKAFPSFMGS